MVLICVTRVCFDFSLFDFHYFYMTNMDESLLCPDYELGLMPDLSFTWLLPTVYAEEFIATKDITHPVIIDTTRGDELVQHMMTNMTSQLKGLPIKLTDLGSNSANQLALMYQHLVESDYGSDKMLASYLSDQILGAAPLKLNFDLRADGLLPQSSYSLPFERQLIPEKSSSGVYAFTLSGAEQPQHYIGSALSFSSRVKDHMSSFNGRRISSLLHETVNATPGGLSNLSWSPLISCNNIVLDWDSAHSLHELSIGARKTLVGFAQFPIRVLEQAMMDQYKPTLNGLSHSVLYFNFSWSQEEFDMAPDSLKIYQALDSNMVVRSTANSYVQLGKQIGLSNVTVRNKMNWANGTTFTINGELVNGYLSEVGVPMRSDTVLGQLHPKMKNPLYSLGDRSLTSLTPGKLFAITPGTFEEFGSYDNERHLWTSLNPSLAEHVESLGAQAKGYLNTRVGRYLNTTKITVTEFGSFLFCRHPDFLAGLAQTASPFYVINVLTGLATYYTSLKAYNPSDRQTSKRHLVKGTLYRGTMRFLSEKDLVSKVPRAEGQRELTLTLSELKTL